VGNPERATYADERVQDVKVVEEALASQSRGGGAARPQAGGKPCPGMARRESPVARPRRDPRPRGHVGRGVNRFATLDRARVGTRRGQTRHPAGGAPNQNSMPRKGFGNLIALPLQHDARQHGNTVFLDADLEPYRDQWAYLAYRAVGYARGEAPLGYSEPVDEPIVEYDEKFLRHFDAMD